MHLQKRPKNIDRVINFAPPEVVLTTIKRGFQVSATASCAIHEVVKIVLSRWLSVRKSIQDLVL